MAAVLLAFGQTTTQLIALWLDSDRPYSHGLLVGPLALWLTLRVCVDSQRVVSLRSFGALVFFAVAVLFWVVGYTIDVLAVQQVLLPALLLLGAASIGGWPVARRLLFPVGLLYFAIPIWTAFTPLLQAVTVAVVSSVLDVFGIPVYVEGNFISIPEGVFEIAGGCAGLHFFIVAVTIASLQGYLSLDGLRPRLLLVGVATALALFTNWIRVGSLVVIGHVTDMQHYLITHEHYYYGWVLFAIALLPLFLFARWQTSAAPEAPTEPSIAVDSDIVPAGTKGGPADWLVPVLFALLLVPPVAMVASRFGEQPATAFDIELPSGLDGWNRVGPGDWTPAFVGADAQSIVVYERGGSGVDVYMAIYRSQSQGRELIGNQNRLFDDSWRPRSSGSVVIAGLPRLSRVREQVVVSPRGEERVIWSWYAIGSSMVADDLLAKLRQALGELRGRDSGAVVAVSAPCRRECAAARASLREFLQAMGEPLAATAASRQAPDEQ